MLEKKQEKIDQEIEEKAIDLATDSIIAADKKKREKDKEAKIREKAVEIVDEYKQQMDPELYEATREEILGSKKDTKKEISKETVEKKTTRTRRKKAE